MLKEDMLTAKTTGQALHDFESIKSAYERSSIKLSYLDGLDKHFKGQNVSIFCLDQQEIDGKEKSFRFIASLLFDALIQFSLAGAGGLARIVPMLVMVFVPSKTARVVKTCITVSIFATALALWSSVAHFMELSDHPITRIARTSGLCFGRIEPQDIVVATLLTPLSWWFLLVLVAKVLCTYSRKLKGLQRCCYHVRNLPC
jgi:hypothetical protein